MQLIELGSVDAQGSNAWVTGLGAHRELRPVGIDRNGPVASCHRQRPNAPIGKWMCSLGAREIILKFAVLMH